MALSILALDSASVAARIDELSAVYLDAYSLPSEAGPPFAAGLLERSLRDGFALRGAQDDATARLIGLAYGFTGLPGQPWRDALAVTLGEAATARWLDRHFEFAEFGVMRDSQRRDVGGRLHDALLAHVPNRRAILTVRTGQRSARGFYERRGWVPIHEAFYGPGGRGPYCIMGRDLALR